MYNSESKLINLAQLVTDTKVLMRKATVARLTPSIGSWNKEDHFSHHLRGDSVRGIDRCVHEGKKI